MDRNELPKTHFKDWIHLVCGVKMDQRVLGNDSFRLTDVRVILKVKHKDVN